MHVFYINMMFTIQMLVFIIQSLGFYLAVAIHKVLDRFIGNLRSPFLEITNNLLQNLDTDLLNLASHHFTRLVCLYNIGSDTQSTHLHIYIITYIMDPLKLVIIFKEEAQVLVCDIDFGITAIGTVFFNSSSTTRESIAIDLVLDLVSGISHEDGRRVNGSAHLGLRTLKSREETSVDQRWLGILETLSNITSETEIRILINSTGDQTGNILLATKDVRERIGEGRCSLNSNKVELANSITEKENAPLVRSMHLSPLCPIYLRVLESKGSS